MNNEIKQNEIKQNEEIEIRRCRELNSFTHTGLYIFPILDKKDYNKILNILKDNEKGGTVIFNNKKSKIALSLIKGVGVSKDVKEVEIREYIGEEHKEGIWYDAGTRIERNGKVTQLKSQKDFTSLEAFNRLLKQINNPPYFLICKNFALNGRTKIFS